MAPGLTGVGSEGLHRGVFLLFGLGGHFTFERGLDVLVKRPTLVCMSRSARLKRCCSPNLCGSLHMGKDMLAPCSAQYSGWQEVFDERAGIQEHEAGLDRIAAEVLAHAEVEIFVMDSKE